MEEKDRKIVDLEIKVTLLEEKVANNATCYNLLERRTSLRINGVLYNGKATAEESLQNVKEEVVKLGVAIEDSQFDRAHRVG